MTSRGVVTIAAPASGNVMQALLRALARYGGILVRPRATVRALAPHEGQRDALLLGTLYVLGAGLYAIFGGIASLRATANLGGLVALAAAFGRVVVVPLLVIVACETVLGRERAHRRGLMLVPLLVVTMLAHELAVHGVSLRSYLPQIVGGLLSVLLAWWVRKHVPPEEGVA